MVAERLQRLGAYEVGPEIGEGGMSVVYRARREDHEFAIKLMKPPAAGHAVDAHLQFRREAAVIARLDHPSLIRVVEVGEDEGRPFLVMELADGESLDRRIATAPLDDEQTLQLARAIADALREVHRFGLVHRDIKPANIVLGEGAAKLIDFGLVTGTTDAEARVGTLHYAPPEQVGVSNREVGPSADLYALGATLFECLTGHHPFRDYEGPDFVHALATVPAPRLDALRPHTRPALVAIVDKLLRKDPDDRYQSARGLLADLDTLDRIDAALGAGGPAPLGLQDHHVGHEDDMPLVGRSKEVSSLERAWKSVLRGERQFVQIEGESGSGKTRLVRELVTSASGQGGLVLFGKCQELESVPFGPLREAADEYVTRVRSLPESQREERIEAIRAAAGDHAGLVRRLSVGLAEVLGDVGEVRALEPDAEQERYYEALASFFRNLASPSIPLVLVVDDVQWLDEGSLRVLGRLAGGPAAVHMLVLSTSRNGPSYEDARRRYLEVVGSELSERIELRPLRLRAVNELITARLGGHPLDPASVEKLAGLTNGNPFAIGEYLRALLEAGVVRYAAGRWRSDPSALEQVNLPKDVVELVVARLYALSEGASAAVGLAGIIGGRFSRGLLEAASDLRPARLSRALEELVRAGLVERTSSDGFAFVHDRVREAAVETLSNQAKRDTHQRIAEELDKADVSSPSQTYARARHYAQGHTERDPERVARTNLAAGLLALEDHANEEALELLDLAHDMAKRAGIYHEVAVPLLEGLGRACAMTGRHDRAFEHLEEALRSAKEREDRFRLQHLLTLTYASQGRNDEALTALYRAFDVLGRPFPKSVPGQVVALVFYWVLAIFLRITGFGYGRAAGPARRRRQVLSQLHYAGSMIALFQGRPVLMAQFVVRDFVNVHFLGRTAEAAIGYAVFGAVLGMFQLRGTMRRYVGLGIEIAQQIGDPAALAVCKAYEATGTKWAGDFARGNQLLVDALPDLHKYVPGSWYAAMMICEQAYSFLHGGLAREAISHVRSHDLALEQTNNLMFRYNTRSVLYAEMMVCGESAAAAELWERLEKDYAPLSQTIYVGLARVIATLEVMVDREETGSEVDATIEQFSKLLSEDYYSNAARMLAGYARLGQYLAATEADSRRRARKNLEREIRGLAMRAMVPVFRAHVYVFKAALARTDGDTAQAKRLLEKATALGKRAGSHRAAYHVAVEQARVERLLGGPAADFYAKQALDVALTQGWPEKARRVRAEFGLLEERGNNAPASGYSTVHQTAARSLDHTRRYADALLQVSLASASTLDPDAQASKALSEVARVLGAERALFFLVRPESGGLELKATSGADASGARISHTVVQRVVDTQSPVVLTGTDEGEAIGSQSIVTYGLRSVMAAPLKLRDRLIGVVYIDSKLAKGMFTNDDVSLLLGLSNHIAIAIETARAARLEAERSALQRDFELLGAVQHLLLPSERTFSGRGLRGAGYYEPAAQCGGDWWWHEAQADGTFWLALGDVSGHGAGAAMISSAVAGSFHTARAVMPDVSPARLLEQIHARIRGFGGGFQMTMGLIRIDPAASTLTWFNAAGPPLFIERKTGCEPVAARGHVLGGADEFDAAEVTVPFGPGDKLLACTDGLLELEASPGRALGARRVAKMFSRLAPKPPDELTRRLGEELDQISRGRPRDDDITFIVVEALDPQDQS